MGSHSRFKPSRPRFRSRTGSGRKLILLIGRIFCALNCLLQVQLRLFPSLMLCVLAARICCLKRRPVNFGRSLIYVRSTNFVLFQHANLKPFLFCLIWFGLMISHFQQTCRMVIMLWASTQIISGIFAFVLGRSFIAAQLYLLGWPLRRSYLPNLCA